MAATKVVMAKNINKNCVQFHLAESIKTKDDKWAGTGQLPRELRDKVDSR